jgi:hypothetical protein
VSFLGAGEEEFDAVAVGGEWGGAVTFVDGTVEGGMGTGELGGHD